MRQEVKEKQALNDWGNPMTFVPFTKTKASLHCLQLFDIPSPFLQSLSRGSFLFF